MESQQYIFVQYEFQCRQIKTAQQDIIKLVWRTGVWQFAIRLKKEKNKKTNTLLSKCFSYIQRKCRRHSHIYLFGLFFFNLIYSNNNYLHCPFWEWMQRTGLYWMKHIKFVGHINTCWFHYYYYYHNYYYYYEKRKKKKKDCQLTLKVNVLNWHNIIWRSY